MAVDWNAWFPKVNKFDNYKNQLKEVIDDISNLGDTFLDVGCGKGRFVDVLRSKGKKVDGLDLYYNNFNLLTDKWTDKKYDVVFSNLCLIVFDKKDASYIYDKMTNVSTKYVYFFDEFRPEYKCCDKVDDGKWKHDPANHLKLEEVYRKQSEVNKIWYRFLFKK